MISVRADCLPDGLECWFLAPSWLSRKDGEQRSWPKLAPPNVSPSNLTHYLRGAQFPASKRDLKADAQKNQAPKEILQIIDELPEDQYRTMAEVMKALGQVE